MVALAAALLFGRTLGPLLLEALGSRAPDLTPLKAPRMSDLPELKNKAYRDEMLWGSYRSGLYFGMKTR